MLCRMLKLRVVAALILMDNGEFKRYVGTFNDFEAVHKCVNEEGTAKANLFGNKIYYATFHGLEALIVGGFVLWVLIMYTITLGVRVVKLAFLRIVSPVPILSYLSPKKSNSFSNWLKQCAMTYLDLFIRIAIIYFAMLLISIIFSRGATVGTRFAVSGDDSMLFIGLDKWFNIILVLGVLLFAKKMPELLADLFPGMGGKGGLDLGLGLKSRTDFAGKGLVTRTAGAAIGAVSMGALGAGQGLFRQAKNANGELEQAHGIKRGLNTLTGGLSGVVRGVRYGAHGGKIRDNIDKAFHNQVAASASVNDYIAAGGDSFTSRIMAGVGRELGLPTAYDRLKAHQQNLEGRKKLNDDLIGTLGQAGGTLDGITDRLSSKITNDDAKTVFSEKTPKHILEYLEAADVIGKDDDGVWKVVKSGRSVYDANGNRIKKPKYGDALFGKRYDEIDNIIENSKNDIQQRIEFLNEEKNKTDQRISTLKAQTATNPTLNPKATQAEINQYKNNMEEIKRLESTLSGYESQLSTAYEELNTINVTAKVKKLKEAGTIGLILGQYDDEVAKNDMITFTIQAESAVRQVDAYIDSNAGSKDPVVIKRTEELKKGAALLDEMNETLKSVRKAASEGTLDDQMIEAELSKFKNEKYKNAVDFDVSNPDGSFETKTIEINNLFDLVDNIANYQKAIMRSKQHENVGLDREIFETNQSAEMVRERLADEHRIGGKGSGH